jgi:hypothetical protein
MELEEATKAKERVLNYLNTNLELTSNKPSIHCRIPGTGGTLPHGWHYQTSSPPWQEKPTSASASDTDLVECCTELFREESMRRKMRFSSFLGLAAVSLIVALPAHATFPGWNGLIAFQSQTDGGALR